MQSNIFAGEQKVWYDGNKKILLWEKGYSNEHKTIIYSESLYPKARKQVLTGRIIVVFLKIQSQQNLRTFMQNYKLSLLKKIDIGKSTYLFSYNGKKENSLSITHQIYKLDEVKASYPDWLYIKQ